MLGWPPVADARPNATHKALAVLEAAGYVSLVITQNVDNLHQRAGQREVIALHGNLHDVVCLQCGVRSARADLQNRLVAMNPQVAGLTASAAPDGDAEPPNTLIERSRVPGCEACGGILKPDVVFFGGAVPKDRVERCYNAVSAAPAMLAVGSSLKVFSGFRFCRAAHRAGKLLVLIYPGWTRADDIADAKFSVAASVLADVTTNLGLAFDA